MAKKRKKKGILDKAIDAVTTRDEREAAEKAKKEAQAAKRKVELEAAKREAAEARARAAEAKAKTAEEKAKEAVAEAKAKAKAALDEEKVRRAQERAAKARELAAAKKRVYVVQPGDSLSKIAKEVLGDASRWPEIFEANKDQIKDPNLIHPGQELRMPS
jgi:nucleoid-associated protein YgaU